MSTLEINKIIAAVLTAGIVASLSGFLANALVNPHELDEPVYVVAGTMSEEATDEAGPEAPDLGTLMAAADAVIFPDLAKRGGFWTSIAEAMAAGQPMLVGVEPEQLLGGRVGVGDEALSVHREDGQGCVIEQGGAIQRKLKIAVQCNQCCHDGTGT